MYVHLVLKKGENIYQMTMNSKKKIRVSMFKYYPANSKTDV